MSKRMLTRLLPRGILLLLSSSLPHRDRIDSRSERLRHRSTSLPRRGCGLSQSDPAEFDCNTKWPYPLHDHSSSSKFEPQCTLFLFARQMPLRGDVVLTIPYACHIPQIPFPRLPDTYTNRKSPTRINSSTPFDARNESTSWADLIFLLRRRECR